LADIFLIAPPGVDLARGLDRFPATRALLLRRGEGDYAAWVHSAAPIAQARDVAVLIEGEPADVKALGADGLHVTSGLAAVRTAVATLKPQLIVGAGGILSRDDAMSLGEAGVDYVFFGPLSGATDERTRELARWWAETMQVSCVLSDPEAIDGPAEAEGCDFIGLGDAVWR
jgi:thiamine-phosphate pyrophosphorylase